MAKTTKIKVKKTPTKPAKPRKQSKAVAKRVAARKAHKEWADAVKARDGGRCQVCGTDQYPQAHHILFKHKYPEYKYDINVGITVCPGCHKFGRYSFHNNPIWSTLWLSANRPAQWEWITEHLGKSFDGGTTSHQLFP